MNKKLLIKVCGIREPENFKDVDNLNPDYLGIIFYPSSPRNMDKNPDTVPDTKAKKVGVFVNVDIETIIKKAREFRLKTIQLHGNETPEICSELQDLGYEVFKAFRINDETQVNEIEPYKNTCKAFLFDTKSDKLGGTGKKFNWEKLNELAPVYPFFLSGGIGPDDVELISKLNFSNLIGLDLNSKFEIKPGLKNVEVLSTFLASV